LTGARPVGYSSPRPDIPVDWRERLLAHVERPRSEGILSSAARRREPARSPAALALLLLVGLAALRSVRPITEWVMTHWAFTYEFGFLRRALVGDLMARLLGPPSVAVVTTAGVVLAAIAAAALLRLFIEPALRERALGAWLFALAAATHSATIPNLFYDLGRFDHIGLLVLLGSLVVLARGTPTLRLALVPPACAVGLLVHEAFLLLFFPLVLAAWHYEERGHRPGPRLAAAASLGALAWAISRFGPMTALPMDAYVAHLEARHEFPIGSSSVLVLYSDLRESMAHSAGMLFSRWQATNHTVLLLSLVPTFAFLRRIARALPARPHRGMAEPRRLILVAALSPLLLYAIGVDVARWWAVAVTNLFIAVAYLAIREDGTRALAGAVGAVPALAAVVVGVSLVAGPLGVLHAYPLFDALWTLGYAASHRVWLVLDWLVPWV
jgi:hypothetical protein